MALVTNLLVYLALLQVVEASANNTSAFVVRENTTVKLVGLDKGLCDFIELPALPRINVLFLFNTPMAACTPHETSLVEFIESSNKILSYSSNRIKCNLRKKEGMIEDTNSTKILPSYTAVLLVTNMFPREWNKARKKTILYQKTKDQIVEYCTGVPLRRKHRDAHPIIPHNLSHSVPPKHTHWSLQLK